MNYIFGYCAVLLLTFSVRPSERVENVIGKNVLISVQLQECASRHEDAVFENYEMINIQKHQTKELDSAGDICLIDDKNDGSIDMFSTYWMKGGAHPRLFNINVKIDSRVSADFVQQFKNSYDLYKSDCSPDDFFYIHLAKEQKTAPVQNICLKLSKQKAEEIISIKPKKLPSSVYPMLINIGSGALLTALVYFYCINIFS